MYGELHGIWKRELEKTELEKLPPDLYYRIADYLRCLREEGRMLDKRSTKARLLKTEMRNVRRMVRELIQTRYRKIVKVIATGEKVPSEFLTVEEERICTDCSPIVMAYQSFTKNLLRGQLTKIAIALEHKTSALRFSKDVPEIIGADMKTYGPFNIEDVASLPIGNAKILVKQGLAEEVEIS